MNDLCVKSISIYNKLYKVWYKIIIRTHRARLETYLKYINRKFPYKHIVIYFIRKTQELLIWNLNLILTNKYLIFKIQWLRSIYIEHCFKDKRKKSRDANLEPFPPAPPLNNFGTLIRETISFVQYSQILL